MANRKGNRRRFGSVRQLKSGRWQARYRDPVTGQLRSAEQTYATKTDAEVALTHIEADISRGQWEVPDKQAVPFAEYADAWLRDRKLAARSRERNEAVIRLHIRPTFGSGSLVDVTTSRVRAWRGQLLAAGVGEPTVVKAYQVLRAIMNTAVDDELVRRNPCRVKGADRYDVPERPVLTVAEVYAVADAMAPRFRLLVLLAAFTTLRFGELASLRRRDIDTAGRVVLVQRAQAEMQDGKLFDKAPKSAAASAPSPSRTRSWPTSLSTWSAMRGRAVTGMSSLAPRAGSCGAAISGTTGSRRARMRASLPMSTSMICGTRETPWPLPGRARVS